MSDQYQCFDLEIADRIAVVALNRPPVNAQNVQFRTEIVEIFDMLGDRPDVRAIVLTGRGKTFSAGADLKERPDRSTPGAYARHNRLVRASFSCVSECAKPVIAAVNGAAIGAGCVLALSCDIILVSEHAFFSMTEVENGLAGGVAHVRRHFGESDARLLIYTARRITGPELLRMNVASACLAADALAPAAREIALEIATKSPMSVRAAKKSFDVTEDLALHDAYRFEQSQTTALADSEDFREAQRAFAEKRKPEFK